MGVGQSTRANCPSLEEFTQEAPGETTSAVLEPLKWGPFNRSVTHGKANTPESGTASLARENPNDTDAEATTPVACLS